MDTILPLFLEFLEMSLVDLFMQMIAKTLIYSLMIESEFNFWFKLKIVLETCDKKFRRQFTGSEMCFFTPIYSPFLIKWRKTKLHSASIWKRASNAASPQENILNRFYSCLPGCKRVYFCLSFCSLVYDIAKTFNPFYCRYIHKPLFALNTRGLNEMFQNFHPRKKDSIKYNVSIEHLTLTAKDNRY